jgi:Rrf2 family transcriptional regulator, iron-sulfur cluster assembly transcription factor
MFSKACEYGIKAMIYIASKSKQQSRVGLNDIAEQIDSPVSFTAKILQKLVKDNLINSMKGPTGGFYISEEDARGIKISRIVSAIDGDSIYTDCGMGFNECNDLRPCVLHHRFKIIREELRYMLEETSLDELTNDVHYGKSFLRSKINN